TESNNMAILGALRAMRGRGRIITSASEHPSVYELFRLLEQRGYQAVYIGTDESGAASLAELAANLTPDTALVSLMHVNNETGAVTDIAAAASLIRSRAPQAVFHVDGVQAYGKLPFGCPPCDLYSVSGHKIHAPKGVGALYVRAGLRFAGGLVGGGQEQGRRSGTTNAPGILGLDAAVAAYAAHQQEWVAAMRACKTRLAERLLSLPDAYLNGPAPEDGAPHILNVSFPGVRGEVLLHALEQREIYVSTGSACSAHKKGNNRVLAAAGVRGARQEGALRLSLCPFNTLEEMDRAAEEIGRQAAFLRRYQRR
ncbi:MAG TPA: cysteine desulfurase, partial [Candidatus Aphodomorpha intestinavium]|nr:cysteine desulfurase [Candidatus Aphodomorpha intestinavium]